MTAAKGVGPWARVIVLGGTLVLLSIGAAVLFGRLVGAQLGLIDDHEIIRFLANGPVGFADVGRLLATTEVGQWGEASRLRPLYYLLRIGETALHGDDAAGWYLTRIVLIAATAFGMAVAVHLTSGRDATRREFVLTSLIALLLGGLVLTLPSLADIVMRLGPSEIYLGPAVALLAIGMVLAWRYPRHPVGWLLATLGYVAAVGAKENGVVLVAPLLVLMVLQWRSARRPVLLAVLAAISLAATAYIAIGVALGTARQSGDIYNTTRSVSGFLEDLPGNGSLFAVILCLAIALACEARGGTAAEPGVSWRTRLPAWVREHPASMAILIGLLVVLADGYLYQENFAHGGFSPARYGFLTQLAVATAVASALLSVLRAHRRALYSTKVLVGAAVIVLLLPPVIGQPFSALLGFRTASAGTAAATTDVHDEMVRTAQLLRDRDGQAVLVIGNAYLEYERSYALPQYLAHYGAPRGVFLDLQLDTQTGDGLVDELTAELVTTAEQGRMEGGWLIRPARDFDPDAYTVCVVFRDTQTVPTECDVAEVIG